MRPEEVNRAVQSSGSSAQTRFSISDEDAVHLIRILRSSLYTDKVLAVLREYATNAWDEHRQAGRSDKPILITLPSALEPTLRIRDFGRGLSWEDIDRVYTKYGASTKRDTDEAAGSMGIGSKSAFAYSDSFTVTSWHGGKKSVYVAVLDETDMGRMDLMHEEPVGSDEETGIEISVPVKPLDVHAFRRTARWLFYYMEPQPMINCLLDEPETQWKGEEGFWGKVVDKWGLASQGWVAIMGCVPYKIDLSQIIADENGSTKGGPPLDAHAVKFLQKHSGGLYFNIGEIKVSANREEVEYVENTVLIIKNRVRAMLARMLRETLTEIRKAADNPWQRRRQARLYERDTGLELPGDGHKLAAEKVEIIEEANPPATFRLFDLEMRGGVFSNLRRTRDLRIDAPFILFRDMDGPLKGYVTEKPMVVVLEDGAKLGDARTELQKLLKAAEVQSIPMQRMSMMTPVEVKEPPRQHTHPGRTRVKGPVNPKHQEHYFVLRDKISTTYPYSRNWDVVERVPQDDDVFVIIHRFEALNAHDFFNRVQSMRAMWVFLGMTPPTIYGVKTTARKPTFKEDVTGIHFTKWMAGQADRILESHPEYKDLLKTYHWAKVFDYRSGHYGLGSWQADRIINVLQKNLDGRHALCRFLVKYIAADKVISNVKGTKAQVLRMLVDAQDEKAPMRKLPVTNLKRIYKKYPLLEIAQKGNGWVVLAEKEIKDRWLDYIRLVDRSTP